MALRNTSKHRAGRRSQGHASHTKTIRTRIQMIYSAQFEQLLYTDEASSRRPRKGKQQAHPQDQQPRDREAVADIMTQLATTNMHKP